MARSPEKGRKQRIEGVRLVVDPLLRVETDRLRKADPDSTVDVLMHVALHPDVPAEEPETRRAVLQALKEDKRFHRVLGYVNPKGSNNKVPRRGSYAVASNGEIVPIDPNELDAAIKLIESNIGAMVVGLVLPANFSDGIRDDTPEPPSEEAEPLVTLSLTVPRAAYPVTDFSVPEVKGSFDDLPVGTADPGYDGSGVILGVIDFGCDIACGSFRKPTGDTRLAALWDQNPLPGSPNGRFFERLRVDQALRAADPYAALQYDPHANYYLPTIEPGAHGTHVLDIASGSGYARHAPGVATGAELIFVQACRPMAVSEPPWIADEWSIIWGLTYIFQKARAEQKPAVVNLSLGHNYGPHDGTSPVERAIDFLLQVPGRAVVVGAGNGRVMNRHASGVFSATVPRVLHWLFMPPAMGAKPLDADLEIWFDAQNAAVAATITSPGGDPPVSVPMDGQRVDLVLGGTKCGEAWYRAPTVLGGPACIASRITNPATGYEDPAGPSRWTVALAGPAANPGQRFTFDAWIECPDPAQSAFAAKDADPDGTLSGIATGRQSVVVGAYDAVSPLKRAAAFTAAGPTRDGRRKPDLSAPGVNVRAARSKGNRIKNPGKPFRTRARVAMSGTSMAAPHVAGAIALMLEKKPAATIAELRTALSEAAQHSPPHRLADNAGPPRAGWDRLYGYGRLDVAAALRKLT